MNCNADPCFVMVSTPGATPHPWRYAKVLRMFHVDTSFHDDDAEAKSVRSNIMWVRWFETDHEYPFGAGHLRLERIRYLDRHSEAATGFIDPQTVIRTVHLQPAFRYGHVVGQGESEYLDTQHGDWMYHNVGR
jgi:hypothetical protein